MTEIITHEEITTYDKLVETLRERLFSYVDKIVEFESKSEKSLDVIISILSEYKESLKSVNPYKPKNMLVLDGASACLNLEIGYIGVYAALAILFPHLRRIYKKDSCGVLPDDPRDLKEFSDIIIFSRLLDLRRERKVLELAYNVIENYDVEVILLDGSLIPIPRTGLENDPILDKEYCQYVRALSKLHRLCQERNILLMGFVKRIRSKLLKASSTQLEISLPGKLHKISKALIDVYDSVIVDFILSDNEYFPREPILIEHKVYNDVKLASVFIKTKRDLTPYRLDVAGRVFSKNTFSLSEFYKALGIVNEYLTSLGIPYPILKVDEEVKLSRKLIREIYDDIRYRYLMKTGGRMISMKALWGEFL